MNGALPGLRDIHLPPPVGWWPPAPGWWLLALLVVVSAALLVRWLRRHRRAGYRRLALTTAQSLYQQWLNDGDDDTYRNAVLGLLKQAAVAAYGRPAVAALNGAAWLEFLDSKLSRPLFCRAPLASWAERYRPAAVQPSPTVIHPALVRWLKEHRC